MELNIIYDVCLTFLSKSKELLNEDNLNNLDKYSKIWFDLFKPFFEIFNEYNNKNNNNNNILYNNILYNNNIIFCYLSGYLPRYEQSLFYKEFNDKYTYYYNNNVKKYKGINDKETLSIHQFLMGSGKSTVIIPYLVYTNLIRDIKTII